MNHRIFLSAAILLSVSAGILQARPVTPSEAGTAASAWLAESAGVFGGTAGTGTAEPIRSRSGTVLGYCVTRRSGGSVIVSGTTEAEPVIALLADGRFADIPDRHPARALILDALRRRFDALRLGAQPFAAAPRSPDVVRAAAESESRWESLLGRQARTFAAEYPPARPTARLIASLPGWEDGTYNHWDQRGGNAYLTLPDDDGYSRYTPNHYYAGCAAIAGTALVQYAGVTQGPEASRRFSCKVDGVSGKLSPIGKPYDWSLLPSRGWMPAPVLTEEAKDLLGRVPYDMGVAANMSYGFSASSASMANILWALRFAFGLKGSMRIPCRDTDTVNTIVEGDLRSGRPVALTVEETSGAGGTHTTHAVVANGFGRDAAGTPYTRIFMGWGGRYDGWFVLPRVHAYSSIPEVICGVGRDIGRYPVFGSVTDRDGRPAAYRTVRCTTSSGDSVTVLTDILGNYCLTVRGRHDLQEGALPPDEWAEIAPDGAPARRTEIPDTLRHGLRGPDFTVADRTGPVFTTDLAAARRQASESGRRLLVLFESPNDRPASALARALTELPDLSDSFVFAYTDGTTVLSMAPTGRRTAVGIFDPVHCEPFRDYESDASGKGQWTAANGLLGETSDTAGLGALLERFAADGDALGEALGHVTVTWLKQHFPDRPLATPDDRTAAALEDTDRDGYANWEEFVLGTDPNDAADRFAVTALEVRPGSLPELTFERRPGRTYTLLSAPAPEGPWRTALPDDRFLRVRIERHP